jgi:outer membrane immunogenic protein
MFTKNWSANIEYQYYNFGHSDLSVGTPLVAQGGFRADEQTVKAGLNYHFDWGSPMGARY